jgi:RNA polymerase sigma-70 factor, ECF subfamily
MKNQDLTKEKELLSLAQKDKYAFDAIYRYFMGDVYRFAYSLSNNQHEAEDLTSQAFVEFYGKLATFEWREISLKYWLFRTVRNIWYTKSRKTKLESYNDEGTSDQEYEISFVDEIINKDLLEQVRLEIQKLSSPEQEVINLRIWEGMQFSEIAELQSEPEPTVKKRFYRAIEKVKKSLESKEKKFVFALPLLFTAIKQTGNHTAYAAPTALAATNFAIASMNAASTSSIASVKAFLATKAGIALLAGTVCLVTVGGVSGTYLAVKAKPGLKDMFNKVAQIENKSSKKEPTPSPTPSVQPTPSPTPEPQVLEYKDETLRVTFSYHKAFEVKENTSNSKYYLTAKVPTEMHNSFYPYMHILLSEMPQVGPIGLTAVKTDIFSESMELPSGELMIRRMYKATPKSSAYSIEYYKYLPSADSCLMFYSAQDGKSIRDMFSKGCYLPLTTDNKLIVAMFSDSLDYDFSKFDNLAKTIVSY